MHHFLTCTLGLTLLAVAALGCNCSDAACYNGVEVAGEWAPQGDLEVDVCVGGDCDTVLMPVDGGPEPILGDWEVARSDWDGGTFLSVRSATGSSIDSPYPAEGTHLSIRVVGETVLAEFEENISYEKFYPNGEGCSPVCDQADYEM